MSFKDFLSKKFSFSSKSDKAPVGHTKQFKKIIIDKITNVLKPLGYTRNGNIYIHKINDLIYYISLQSSRSSSSLLLKITVNIEMASMTLALFRDDRMPLNAYRTYHKRIGDFMNEQTDKWWLIANISEAMAAADEIGTILINKVIPVIGQLTSTDDYVTMAKKRIWRDYRSTAKNVSPSANC